MSVDVSATAHGRTWQHTRSFSNSLGTHAPAFNGHGWCVPIHFEYLIMGQDENGNMFYALVVDGNQVIWFGKNPGEESTHYIFADDYRIVASGGDVTVFMPDGSRAMFYGPSEDQPLRGKLRSRHDPGGLDSVYVYENGRLSTMTQTIGGASVKFLYEWIEIPQAGFRLANVALEIDHQIVAAAYYEYHLNGSLQGRAGDLRRVQRARLSPIPGGGIENVGDSWYTYHLTDFRGLKFALEQEALARVRAANIDPATVTNFTTFADFHFEYDSSGRVTSETVKGGAYTYTFDYFSRGAGSGESSSSSSGPVNPYPTEFNSWRYGTIETRPDGTKNTIYCNAAGQTMLHVFSSGANDWLTGYRFGEKGRVIRKAESSAIASYDPADDGLFTLRDDSGLIRDFTDTFPTSDPDGVVKITTITVREGRDGAPVKVRELGYAQPVADWGQKYALARDIVYQGEADGGSVPSTTRWVRQYAGTLLALQSETLWPAVPAAQNGSGASDARVQVFNTRGQVTWEKDERGYISHWVYDSSGRLLKSIADVNTGSPSASDPAPNGWQSRSDGGLHLVTDYLADALGRTTLELGPAHSLPGITATVRRAHWTVYRDSIHERYEASGYLQGGTATLINPVHVSQFDLNGRLIAQIEAIRASTSEPIAPGESFPQSTWARWTATIYDNQSHLAAQRVYHAIPTEAEGVGTSGTHYAETQFGYDAMGRRNRVRTPMGTITRTVFHPRGWEQSTWVGTNDTGSTDADPTGGTVGAANGNNMVKIAERTHDGGAAGGDGHLTRTRLFLADTVPPTPGTARTTDMTYDFRGRRLATDGEMDFYESYLSDNVGRVLAVERRDTDASGNLFARTETRFDARGRVYESRTYGIDPANPPAANVDWETVPKVSALTWYNATGSVIKRRNQEGAGFEKMTYDSLGRTSRSAITIDASETGYSAALTLDGDTVLEQTEYVYDAVGNVRFQRVCERDHDATGTGSLTGPPGVAVPHSRISCRAFYYDGLGRQVATANYGTHGGSEPAHTNDVPTSTDTCLVNRSNYDSRGDLIETIDPMGIVTRSTFDAAGRLLKTVENYWPVPGETASDKNRTTEYTYNLDGKLTVLTAHNAATGPQLTRYVYGTTLTDPGVASFELLRAKIYPDSDDTISPLGNGPDGIYDRVEYSYNRLGELIGQKDQNGTVHAYDHDALGRLIHDRVTTLGTGIDDAIQRISRSYEVRGLLARVSSCSNPDPNATTPSVVNEVLLQYNAFGKLIAEYQEHSGAVAPDSTPKVLYNYSAGATNSTRLLSITYPNGRVISYDYGTSGEPDALLGRVREIRDGSTPPPLHPPWNEIDRPHRIPRAANRTHLHRCLRRRGRRPIHRPRPLQPHRRHPLAENRNHHASRPHPIRLRPQRQPHLAQKPRRPQRWLRRVLHLRRPPATHGSGAGRSQQRWDGD